MSDWKGKGIWKPVLPSDVMEVLRERGGSATYVVANILRHQDRYRNVKTSQVLYRLKALEKEGRVKRVADRRNPYSRQLMWELPAPPENKE